MPEQQNHPFHPDTVAANPQILADYEQAQLDSVETSRVANQSRLKKFGAAIALIATVHTTGIQTPGETVDRVLEGRQTASEFVDEALAFELQEPVHAGYNSGELPDLSQADADRINAEIESDNSETQKIFNRIGRTMNDLDNHNSAAIKERAQEFEAQNTKDILSTELIDRYHKDLTEATTQAQVMAVADCFMGEYGSNAFLHEDADTDVDRLKYAVSTTIDALSPLPKSLVKSGIGSENYEGALQKGIEFAIGALQKSEDFDVTIYGTKAAEWDDYDGKIRLFVTGHHDLGPVDLNVADLKGNILHELAHSIDPVVPNGVDNSASERLLNFGGKILGRPNYVSDYATKNGSEEYAETGEKILSGDLTHPDEVREYTSPANKTVLRQLYQLEVEYPGITDYLIARNNPELLK